MKSDLQQVVMQTRMEPVSSIIARLQRSVRQAVRITGKQADLIIEGGGIQLDSEVLGRLAEPLMHMLRNAVDHGIETPAERIARGKSETGTISLRFSQEGQNVVIRCTDDGRGLDYARIQAIAVEKGLLTGSTNVGKETLARLIMTPGFSTRSDTTQLSGRGIGMDVVQTTIRELQGIIEIGDGESGGCRISLRLPITLLTSHSLVVRVGSERYAIPSSSIMQVVSPQQGRFTMIGNRLAYELGRDTYPVTALSACLQPHGDAGRPAANSSIVMIYSDAGPVAVAVDQLINNYSIIVKSPGRYVGPIRGVVGLSSLADGSLIPVLDVAELLRAPVRARSVPTATATMTAPAQPPQAVVRIMIVDDSISVRQTLSDLVADAGYEALVARDGLEAVDLLRQLTPDLVLTDIEMPRMNGLELVSYIRTSHSTELPVIVITSRTMQKHRQQAAEAGANSYISKPFDEDELLTLIRSLLE
jgi:chemosensory pili system protein ChpA (sensor histidine kinase/response regulator)